MWMNLSFCFIFQAFSSIKLFICLVAFITVTLFNFLTSLIEIHISFSSCVFLRWTFRACILRECVWEVCVRILTKMYFHPESGKWWTGSPRQCPLSPPSVFLLLHLSFRYRSTLSLSFALSIPKSLFSLDCLSLINLMLNLETYFSKSKGLERERSADKKNGLPNSCLSSFIYLLDEQEVVTEISFCLLSLCRRCNFFLFSN